jgi:hypothetical protein
MFRLPPESIHYLFARERLTQPLRESGIGRHFSGGPEMRKLVFAVLPALVLLLGAATKASSAQLFDVGTFTGGDINANPQGARVGTH